MRRWWLLGLVACGRVDPEGEIDRWADESGLSFVDCGVVTDDSACGALEPAEQDTLDCFFAAVVDCTAARYEHVQPTIEGDPLSQVVFVVPGGEVCSFRVFTDTTEDQFGAQALYSADCATIQSTGTCPWVQTDDCTNVTCEGECD